MEKESAGYRLSGLFRWARMSTWPCLCFTASACSLYYLRVKQWETLKYSQHWGGIFYTWEPLIKICSKSEGWNKVIKCCSYTVYTHVLYIYLFISMVFKAKFGNILPMQLRPSLCACMVYRKPHRLPLGNPRPVCRVVKATCIYHGFELLGIF